MPYDFNLLPARASITESEAYRFRVSEKLEQDLLQRLAGDFYASAAPGQLEEVAKRLGMGTTTWWRRTSGTEPTPLSRAGEEALRFRRAGFGPGWFSSYLAVVDLLPDLEGVTAERLNEALILAHADEDDANGQLQHYQGLHLSRGKPCFFGMARAALQQQDRSALLARLSLRLHLLTGGR